MSSNLFEKGDLFIMRLKKLSPHLSLKAGVNDQGGKNTRTQSAWAGERRRKER